MIILTGCYTIEEGEKTGQIIGLKKSGIFVKTWECRIIRGGLQDGSGNIGTSLQLTIEDKSLLEKAKKYMDEKKMVSLKYHQEFITFFRSESDSENCFIDSIEEMK
jgi:hypothetical protein